MTKVSAIVSAYYAEEYIEGRIANLKAQDCELEIVVIAQLDTPEAKVARTNKCTVIYTPDIPTIYDAWNMGIKEASGDYVTSANSDDRLYPGALARMAQLLDDKQHIGVVYPDVNIVEEIDGKPVSKFTWAEGGLAKLLEGCFVGPAPMWRKSLHEKHGHFDAAFHIAGDYEWWLRLATAGVKFQRIAEPLGAYLKRKDSAEHREQLRTVWETARARGRYR